jgi:hypothetical protein
MTAPEPDQILDARGVRIGNALVGVLKAYGAVVIVFAAGMTGSLIVKYIMAYAPPSLPKPWTENRLSQTAWVVCSLFVAFGLAFKWFTPKGGWPTVAHDPHPFGEPDPNDPPPYTLHPAVSLGVISLILGFLIGGALAAMWISATVSPFAVEDWVEPIRRRFGIGYAWSAIPKSLWFGTTIVFAVLGVLFGLIGTPLGWLTTEMPRQLRRSISTKAIKEPSK